MFGLKKRGPTRPFTHADDCKILKSDPGVEIEWSEIERGHWVAVCQCGEEHYRERVADHVRSDPLNAHLGAPECEFAATTDPAVLRVILKVRDGAGGTITG